MKHWKHLTFTDRLRIEKWLRDGMRPRAIAEKLRVDHTTIYRELKRGEYQRLDGDTWETVTAYSPDIAQARYESNMRAKGPGLKIGNDREFAEYIEQTILERDCSPAAALAFARHEGRTFKTDVSVATLYSYIKKGVFLHLTQKELPRQGKTRRKYEQVTKKKQARAPAGESIEKRPEEIQKREEFGHWEMDTVYSAANTTSACLLTIIERLSRKGIIILMPNRKTETVTKALDALERKYGAATFRRLFKSITVDNGSEFAAVDKIERSAVNKTIPRTKVYFCHPYSSYERGSNENFNGFARRKHPKGTSFARTTKADIAATEAWLNDYPRKILGWKSAEMVFREEAVKAGIRV